MRQFLRWMSNVLIWVVALMSGLFSLYRAVMGLYQGQNAAPRNTFERCSIIAFIVSAVIVWFREVYARKELESKFRGLPKLTLRPKALQEETRYTLIPIPGGSRTRSVPFSCVILRITNDPTTSAPDSIAKQVGAFLTFYDSQGIELFSFAGRWGDTPQPTQLEHSQGRFELLNVDFPIGGTRELNIVIKYTEDVECYGFNNDSYGHQPFLNNPRWRLDGELFSVRIRVQGIYVDKTWTVQFKNLGIGKGVEPINCTEIIGSA